MTNIVIQPARDASARRNFARTVDSPVVLADVADKIESADLEVLQRLHPAGLAPMWGTTAGESGQKIPRWSRLAMGDIVLFTGGREVFKTATITHRFRSRPLAERLWAPKTTANGLVQHWEYMFAFNSPNDVSIPYEEFGLALGDIAFPTREFAVLKPEGADIAISVLREFGAMPTPAPGPGATDQVVREFDSVDGRRTASYRKEQRYLKQYLAPGSLGVCVLCGREFPTQLLVAAHIKKRSHCTFEEKVDIPAIAMLACRFGCDELFEHSMIMVNSRGVIEQSPHLPPGTPTDHFNSYLAGRTVHRWSSISDSHKYFAEHRARATGI